jgi:Putative quorum-sensing-regulated virulence factor
VSTLDNTVDDTSWAGTGVIMPFGKHAGVPIAEVPLQYLGWLYTNCNFTIYPELQRAVEQRLGLPPDPVIRGGPPKEGKEAQTCGREQSGANPRRETGLDLFRRSFTDCRNSILVQYQEDDAAFDFATGILDRVQRALGI